MDCYYHRTSLWLIIVALIRTAGQRVGRRAEVHTPVRHVRGRLAVEAPRARPARGNRDPRGRPGNLAGRRHWSFDVEIGPGVNECQNRSLFPADARQHERGQAVIIDRVDLRSRQERHGLGYQLRTGTSQQFERHLQRKSTHVLGVLDPLGANRHLVGAKGNRAKSVTGIIAKKRRALSSLCVYVGKRTKLA